MTKEEKEIAPVVSETPAPEQAEASEPTPETPKHKYADRLSKAYPDRKFENDGDYDTAMDEYLGDLEGFKERGSSLNNKLIALFDAEPQAGAVVRDMINGATFREALARHLSPEDLTAVEGDPDYEGWSKNKSAREEGMKKRKAREDEYNASLAESQKTLAAFAEKEGWDEQKAVDFIDKFDGLIADVNNGKITPEILETVKKAFSYDNDLAAVNERAGIAKNNQQIIEKKEAEPAGDGLPRPATSSEPPAEPKKQEDYMGGLFDRVKKKQVI